MKQVTKDEFYAFIGPQDVIPVPEGPWPYTSYFKTKSGRTVGTAVSRSETPDALWPIVTDYFIEQG